jgi:hypothetical protein
VTDLVTFLRERLDEEERLATAASRAGIGVDIGPDGHAVSSHPDAQDHIATWCPVRVLAEVDAKRRIVEGLAEADPHSGYITGTFAAEDVLCLLALPHAEHPDYDPAWRPA